jgi:hypothetical protein
VVAKVGVPDAIHRNCRRLVLINGAPRQHTTTAEPADIRPTQQNLSMASMRQALKGLTGVRQEWGRYRIRFFGGREPVTDKWLGGHPVGGAVARGQPVGWSRVCGGGIHSPAALD